MGEIHPSFFKLDTFSKVKKKQLVRTVKTAILTNFLFRLIFQHFTFK